MNRMQTKFNPVRPLAILMVGSICFFATGYIDGQWTLALWANPSVIFTDVMSRSVYEGNLPGMSDIGVTLPILAFLVWVWRRYRPQETALQDQTQQNLKFLFLTGLFASLATIHSFKWIVSRARPKVFLTQILPALNVDPSSIYLPGFMGWAGPRGASWNSFPSGHACSCALFIVFSYLNWKTSRYTAVLWFIGAAIFTALMGIGRSMAGMHWISDSVASFFLVWAVTDIIWQRLELR